nr:unnamed protein product [Callosobruchus chinensis]
MHFTNGRRNDDSDERGKWLYIQQFSLTLEGKFKEVGTHSTYRLEVTQTLGPLCPTRTKKCCNVTLSDSERQPDNLEKQTPRIATFRDFKNFDQERFTADLFSINWIDAKFISDNIIALFDHHAPLKTIRVTKPRAPWLTPNLKLLMKLRDKALHRFRKNPSQPIELTTMN